MGVAMCGKKTLVNKQAHLFQSLLNIASLSSPETPRTATDLLQTRTRCENGKK